MPELSEHHIERHMPSRENLLRELQKAHTGRRYDSPALRKAVTEFVHGAHHCGLELEWALTAIDDAINTGVLPPLDDVRRHAISAPVRRIASEAYASCAGEHSDRKASPPPAK